MISLNNPTINPKVNLASYSLALTTENQLVEALRAGSAIAFTNLYRDYAQALLGIVSRFVKSSDLAEDVLQEVFVKISKSIHSYDPTKGRLFTWMARTAKNSAIDHLRSRNHINSLKNDDFDDLFESIEPKMTTSQNTDAIGIKQLVLLLPENQRFLLDLIYFQGYTHAEIADEFSMPIGTVKTRLRAAILTLRNHFKRADKSAA